MKRQALIAAALVLCAAMLFVPQADAAQELTELQTYWNRPWYGLMYVESATGSFINTKHMDVHMTVKADEDGNATLCVYIDPDSAPFAAARGKITMDGFTAQSGMVLDKNVTKEFMLVKTNYTDMYALMHTYTAADGSELSYLLYVKPWGETWEEQIAANHVVPTGYRLSYIPALDKGGKSPVETR